MKKLLRDQLLIQRGFTLIEVIIVIAIMATLIGLATINLSNASQQASLSTTTDNFIADLKEQQMKAISGATEGSGATANSDYGVRIESSQYTLFRSTFGTSNFAVTLPPSIQLSETFIGSDIVFTKGSGELFGITTVQITFTDLTTGNTKTITLNRYGVVTGIN